MAVSHSRIMGWHYWEATMAWGAELMGVEGIKELVASWRAPVKKVGPNREEIPS